MNTLTERHWVTIGTFALASALLAMATRDPTLWEREVFKVILQAVVLTGLLNMILAFHFTSNKGSEQARENTGKAFEAITAAANASSTSGGAVAGAEAVADAATDKANEIATGAKP